MALKVTVETPTGDSYIRSTFEVPLSAIGAGTVNSALNQAAISQFMLDTAAKASSSTNLTLSSEAPNGESALVSRQKFGVPKVQLNVSRIGEPLKIITPVDATVGSLRQVIANQLGEDPEKQLLACGGERLYDSHILTDIIQREFTIHLSKALTIYVRTCKGQEIKLNVTSSDSIAKLKEKVEEKQGIAPQHQRLIFAGKQLCESLRLDEVRTWGNTGIEEGSVLHLVEALRGC